MTGTEQNIPLHLGMNMDRVHDYVTQSFAGESDDSNLMCCVCQLKFTSLYNKQSHYSGKLHFHTMIENLHKLIKSMDQFENPSESNRIGVSSSIEDVASEYRGMYMLKSKHKLNACYVLQHVKRNTVL